MSSVITRAQATVAQGALERQSGANRHGQAKLKRLSDKREEQREKVDQAEEMARDLEVDLAEHQGGGLWNGIKTVFGQGNKQKRRKIQNEMAGNAGEMEAAQQKLEIAREDQKDVFAKMESANAAQNRTIRDMEMALSSQQNLLEG